jgi:hypothetical protein
MRAALGSSRFSVTIFVRACLLLWPLAQAQWVFASDWGSSCAPAASANTIRLPERGVRTRSDGRPRAQPTPAGLPADEEAILASFDASEPTTVEEEVANSHRLAIVSRLTLEPLGKRVVRFRIPDARSTMELVAELSSDARVNSAQPNFRYQMSDRSRISGLRPQPARGANKQKRLAAGQCPNDSKTRSKRIALQRRGPLVAGNQDSLQWPTAAEPYVDVGARSR